MDNFELTVQSEGRKQFDLAMQIAFRDHAKAVGYRISKEKGLILYWSKTSVTDLIPFAYDMNCQQATEFVWGWIESNPPKGERPDHDGDNEKGFIVYTDSWGHVDGQWQAFVGIGVIWAMYGK